MENSYIGEIYTSMEQAKNKITQLNNRTPQQNRTTEEVFFRDLQNFGNNALKNIFGDDPSVTLSSIIQKVSDGISEIVDLNEIKPVNHPVKKSVDKNEEILVDTIPLDEFLEDKVIEIPLEEVLGETVELSKENTPFKTENDLLIDFGTPKENQDVKPLENKKLDGLDNINEFIEL